MKPTLTITIISTPLNINRDVDIWLNNNPDVYIVDTLYSKTNTTVQIQYQQL